MADLRELATRLVEAAGQFRNVKDQQKLVEQNVREAKAVRDVTGLVEARATFLKETIGDGSLSRSSLPQGDIASARRTVREVILADKASRPGLADRATRDLKDLDGYLRVATVEGWRQISGSLNLDERQVLLEALRHVPAYAGRVRDLKDLLRTLQAQLRSPYLTGSDYRLFKETLEEFEEAFETLQVSNSEVIQDFLGKFVRGTATLADLVPEVHAWIKEQKIESSFYLRTAR